MTEQEKYTATAGQRTDTVDRMLHCAVQKSGFKSSQIESAESRHDLDSIVGAENSPDLVFRLRKAGFDIPCKRRRLIDRDGETIRVEIYSLSAVDRAKANAALRLEAA